ncbi:MAG: shikimate kinase [Clostridiales bacterium]|nr:shikimate kinase [Clostridiales bacterium]
MKSNIVLIGMAASGKSTTGVVLAKTINKNFVDTDLYIQQRTGKTLQDILNQDGIEVFKEIEEDILKNVDAENCVISTGGSAVYYPEAMKALSEKGIIVYLNVPLEVIEERLSNIKTRGVILKKGETIADLYYYRKPMYEEYADIVIDAGSTTLEETIELICEAVNEYGEKGI